jgi:hypothetical protein
MVWEVMSDLLTLKVNQGCQRENLRACYTDWWGRIGGKLGGEGGGNAWEGGVLGGYKTESFLFFLFSCF